MPAIHNAAQHEKASKMTRQAPFELITGAGERQKNVTDRVFS